MHRNAVAFVVRAESRRCNPFNLGRSFIALFKVGFLKSNSSLSNIDLQSSDGIHFTEQSNGTLTALDDCKFTFLKIDVELELSISFWAAPSNKYRPLGLGTELLDVPT